MRSETAIYIILVLLTLLAGYTVYRFVMVKAKCEDQVLASQSAYYADPGAEAKRKAAFDAAMASPACVNTRGMATFILAFGRDS